MADENNSKPGKSGPRWALFVLPAILAAIGVYLALNRPAPNAEQQLINAAAGIPAPHPAPSASP